MLKTPKRSKLVCGTRGRHIHTHTGPYRKHIFPVVGQVVEHNMHGYVCIAYPLGGYGGIPLSNF